MKFKRLFLIYAFIFLFTGLFFYIFYRIQRKTYLLVSLEEAKVRSSLFKLNLQEELEHRGLKEDEFLSRIVSLSRTYDADYLMVFKAGEIKYWDTKYEGFLPVSDLKDFNGEAFRVVNSPLYPLIECGFKVGDFSVVFGYSNYHLNWFLNRTLWGMGFILLLELVIFGLSLFAFYLSEKKSLEAELRYAKEREEAKYFRELSAMAMQIAHEIRNPLNTMSISLQLIEREGLKGEFLTPLKESLNRILEVVSKLSDIKSQIRVDKSVVDCEALVEEIIALFKPQIEAQGIVLLKEVEVKKCTTDKVLVRQAISNIIKNSVEALREKGGEKSIRVKVQAKGNWVEFSVEDNGKGIPKDSLEKIFDHFFTTKPDGMGLGLSFVKRVAQSLGGDVTVESDPSWGTRVIFRIPNE